MHSMHLSNKRELSKTRVSRLRIIVKTTSILATIIDAEVANTKASFLAFKTANT